MGLDGMGDCRRSLTGNRWLWKVLCWVMLAVVVSSVPVWAQDPGLDGGEPLVPFRYAYVGGQPVSLYPSPGGSAQMTPVHHLFSPNTWVSIKEEVRVGGRVWYRIGQEEYVLGSEVSLGSPSTFRGVPLGQAHRPPLGFVVAAYLNVRARPGAAPDNPPLRTLSRYTLVSILGQEAVEGRAWYQIAPGQYVHGGYIRAVTATARPLGVAPGEKWVAVNLSQQTLAAYEGDRMVFATLVSTGLPGTRTPEGLFRIWAKVVTGKMSGGSVESGDYYYLQDVPWTMYFHGGYGLHGAYWHDDFGNARSRGCINLSPRDARWLFEWTSPPLPEGRRAVLSDASNAGTWVYVYSRLADVALARAHMGRANT